MSYVVALAVIKRYDVAKVSLDAAFGVQETIMTFPNTPEDHDKLMVILASYHID
ncbi:hypothetical protein [Photorhabdus heterorhabditis]|uniref:hypothetical protein n=1 Tax=Photorhabdus heterorhabditis TaxID=880156 RepID=UPI00137925E6|nr:hypothetical protein [Photorhabdus heterorhabditis]